MSEHHATIRWARTTADFSYGTYNRAHDIAFKHGAIVVPASAAPQFKGDEHRVDPEEAFVASLSSCHMLTFLAICARKRIAVDAYDDEPVGYLEKDSSGKFWMARVVLRPKVRFATGMSVDKSTLASIHHHSHDECFIARSVKTEVVVEQE